jgi:hypothetical protein
MKINISDFKIIFSYANDFMDLEALSSKILNNSGAVHSILTAI